MGHQVDPVELECVQQFDDVGEQSVSRVSLARHIGPAGAAQVGADHPVALGQTRDHLPPLPPVLGESVQ
jgi:hypothetical protein